MAHAVADKPWDMRPRTREVKPVGKPAFTADDLTPGAVYRLHRAAGLTPLAVYTGGRTATGRCRFEVVDRKFGELSRFSARPDAVLGKAADSLAEWCKRMGWVGGEGSRNQEGTTP
jgi:hypothetical protein